MNDSSVVAADDVVVVVVAVIANSQPIAMFTQSFSEWLCVSEVVTSDSIEIQLPKCYSIKKMHVLTGRRLKE